MSELTHDSMAFVVRGCRVQEGSLDSRRSELHPVWPGGRVGAGRGGPAGYPTRYRGEKPASGRLSKDYLAQAYASTRGSAPALRTPVLGSMAMAAFEPNDQAPADCNL